MSHGHHGGPQAEGSCDCVQGCSKNGATVEGQTGLSSGTGGDIGSLGCGKHTKGRDLGNEVRLFVLRPDKHELRGQV